MSAYQLVKIRRSHADRWCGQSLFLVTRGYGISDTKNFTDFSVKDIQLKKVGPREVTLEIMFCGGECLDLPAKRTCEHELIKLSV